jgi:transposase
MSPMERKEQYHMTKKEMVRLKVAERLIERAMRVEEASHILDISTRQVIRIKGRVKEVGPEAVIHGNRKRKPINATAGNVKDLVVELKKEKYEKANFSHFAELILENEKIGLSRPTVHRILTQAGISSPRKKKKVRAHRYRKRMDCPGAMVQLDASPYEWLGGEKLNLHGAIDDAAGIILGLYMTEEECLEGYFEVARQMIKGTGIPISTYNDRHTILVSPKKAKVTIEDQLEGKTEPYTQFSAAMDSLGVNMIAAGSPEAKGRIERLWGTLQDRLTVEFGLNGIKDIDSANHFMKGYIDKFNRRFAVVPKGEPVFRKLDKGINLDHILCTKIPRKLDRGSAFSFRGSYYQLIANGKPAATIPRSSVKVLLGSRIGLKAEYSGKVYSLSRIEKPKAKGYVKVKEDKRLLPKKVAGKHPWKNAGKRGFAYDSRDEKIAEGLYNSTIAWETDSY